VTNSRMIRGAYAGEERVVGPEHTAHQRAQDQWQRFLEHSVGEAIGRWLTANGRLSRRIRELTTEELEAIGVAACAEYAKVREAEWRDLEEMKAEAPLDQKSDLSNA
jgi:hypothetical protein